MLDATHHTGSAAVSGAKVFCCLPSKLELKDSGHRAEEAFLHESLDSLPPLPSASYCLAFHHLCFPVDSIASYLARASRNIQTRWSHHGSILAQQPLPCRCLCTSAQKLRTRRLPVSRRGPSVPKFPRRSLPANSPTNPTSVGQWPSVHAIFPLPSTKLDIVHCTSQDLTVHHKMVSSYIRFAIAFRNGDSAIPIPHNVPRSIPRSRTPCPAWGVVPSQAQPLWCQLDGWDPSRQGRARLGALPCWMSV